MRSLGINYNPPSPIQLEKAMEEVILMPSYPDFGCVKIMNDFILIRISEILYRYPLL
jgi:hypothetical protein